MSQDDFKAASNPEDEHVTKRLIRTKKFHSIHGREGFEKAMEYALVMPFWDKLKDFYVHNICEAVANEFLNLAEKEGIDAARTFLNNNEYWTRYPDKAADFQHTIEEHEDYILNGHTDEYKIRWLKNHLEEKEFRKIQENSVIINILRALEDLEQHKKSGDLDEFGLSISERVLIPPTSWRHRDRIKVELDPDQPAIPEKVRQSDFFQEALKRQWLYEKLFAVFGSLKTENFPRFLRYRTKVKNLLLKDVDVLENIDNPVAEYKKLQAAFQFGKNWQLFGVEEAAADLYESDAYRRDPAYFDARVESARKFIKQFQPDEKSKDPALDGGPP